MKILITGGSGFLGINLVRHLLSKGSKDIVIIDIVPFEYPERDRVSCIQGDIRDREMVRRIMAQVGLVVHAAAALPLYSKENIYSTDVNGTENLLEEAYQNHVERFIHISSTAVYGVPDHHPIVEDDKLQGVGAYGEAKILAEQVCEQYRAKGMCVPILRPKSFIGPERLGVFALLYEWAREGRNFPILGKGNNRYQFLDVADLCEAIDLCANGEKAVVNTAFNIGAKIFTTLKEDFQAVLDKAGFGKRIIPLPKDPVIFFLKIAESLGVSPLYQWIYETVCVDSFVSIEKAEARLGFQPKYSNQDALLRNFEWYLHNCQHFREQTGISHRAPWKQGVLKVAKLLF